MITPIEKLAPINAAQQTQGGSAAGDVTFKAGNGIQGVADLVVNVANGKTKAVVLESGAFKKAGKAGKFQRKGVFYRGRE